MQTGYISSLGMISLISLFLVCKSTKQLNFLHFSNFLPSHIYPHTKDFSFLLTTKTHSMENIMLRHGWMLHHYWRAQIYFKFIHQSNKNDLMRNHFFFHFKRFSLKRISVPFITRHVKQVFQNESMSNYGRTKIFNRIKCPNLCL